MSGNERLEQVLEQTERFHASLEPMWMELPSATSKRALLVIGFGEIVKQHATSQWLLIGAGLQVSATTLVRPAFEALVRAIWSHSGAEDAWIEKFLSQNPEAINSDAETEMGPSVGTMLGAIKIHHPAQIHEALAELKQRTWRAMHSYVHGGIRPLAQSLSEFSPEQAANVVINANGMVLTATNVVRMASGLRSPGVPRLQMDYACCLPPSHPN